MHSHVANSGNNCSPVHEGHFLLSLQCTLTPSTAHNCHSLHPYTMPHIIDLECPCPLHSLCVVHLSHCTGGVGYAQDDFVEYDLDTEDEKWLATYNRGSDLRLSDLKFERMLWRLELAWAEAIEGTLTPAGVCVRERGGCLGVGVYGRRGKWRSGKVIAHAIIQSVSEWGKKRGSIDGMVSGTLSLLAVQTHTCTGERIFAASTEVNNLLCTSKMVPGTTNTYNMKCNDCMPMQAVYDYWAAKRKKWGKPLLRRLQAPTNPSDTNPYNVFRCGNSFAVVYRVQASGLRQAAMSN
eukprot:1161864-Pelagomonas_calceolata.AAC.18